MKNDLLRSSLLAGVIALVIWTVISLFFGMDRGVVAMWAIIFFIGTTVVTYIISALIARSKA